MKKSIKKIVFPVSLLLLGSLVACSSTKKIEAQEINEGTQNRNVNNSIGVNNDASWYTELNFRKGSTKLNHSDFAALDDLVKKSIDTGSVNEIKIISWPDQEYPNKSHKALSYQQKTLADRRNERIKDYLKQTYPALNVSVYNMAKRPNGLQDLFSTSDSRTKKSIENAGITFDENHHVNHAKKESTALVLSILK